MYNVFFFFSNPRKYVMYVRKKINVFIFICKIFFREKIKIKHTMHVRQNCLMFFQFFLENNKIFKTKM